MTDSGKVSVLFVAASQRDIIPPKLREVSTLQMLVATGPVDKDLFNSITEGMIACCHVPVEAAIVPTLNSLEAQGIPILGIGYSRSPVVQLVLDPDASRASFRSALELLTSISPRLSNLFSGPANKFRIEDIVKLFERALELWLPGSRERAERINWLAAQVAKHMGLTKAEISELSIAIKLSEIGKVGLPEPSFYKEHSAAGHARQRAIENFAAQGASVLKSVPELSSVARIVGYQAESVDGTGPAGMISTLIPLSSRILRVCADYDKLAERFGADNADEVLATLWKGVNRAYDADLLAALDSVVSKREHKDSEYTERVALDKLKPGMTLGQSVYSPAGVRVLAYGAVVAANRIDLITYQLQQCGQTKVVIMPRVRGLDSRGKPFDSKS